VAAWSPGTLAYREELPPDELTAVFAPSPELLARSGRQLTPGGSWEEPTQVVSVGGELLEKLAGSAPPAPLPGPTAEQLNFERQLAALATPVPRAKGGGWLLWAVLLVLLGAGAAAAVEYTLHPSRLGMPARH
jgi:hypothetical protein